MRDPEIIEAELMEISAIADHTIKFERIIACGEIVWLAGDRDFDWQQTTALSVRLRGQFHEERCTWTCGGREPKRV
jgi:hypothetical protein